MILVVEDEDSVRDLVRDVLRADGHEVLVATDSANALEVLEEYGKAIDLLLTDVVMPGTSGVELARELGRRQPGLQVVFMSGYTDRARDVSVPTDAPFLAKPFTPKALRSLLRRHLAGPESETESETA